MGYKKFVAGFAVGSNRENRGAKKVKKSTSKKFILVAYKVFFT
jgi:hypothetical protein